MAGYKERLAEDLDRWIAAGLVAGENRQQILESVPEARRLDAASALAWIGAVLLGVALIAFIAANWDGIPRLARFALVISVFAGAAGAAAWAAHRGRPNLANGLLTFAALAFAAAIGLTGQIFDIAGDPRAALYGAGVAAAALALAGRSSGAAIACLLFFGNADFFSGDWLFGQQFEAPWLIVAAPIGALLAIRWGSPPLAHAASVGVIASFVWFLSRFEQSGAAALFLSVWLGAMAAGGRWMRAQGRPFGGVFYGWFAWAALGFFALAGYVDGNWGILHRLVWLAAASALVALGRYDKHNMVSAAGVVGLVAGIGALLTDLNLDLMVAAGLFFTAALIAMVVGYALRRRAKA